MMDEGQGVKMAQAYVDTVNSGRFEDMVKLFTSDATICPADGNTYAGSESINAFYSRHLAAVSAQLRLVLAAATGNTCFFLIEAVMASGNVDTVDIIDLHDSGLIARMRAFPSSEQMRAVKAAR